MSSSTSDLHTKVKSYLQKLRDFFRLNVRSAQRSSDCKKQILDLQQQLDRLQAGSKNYATTQRQLAQSQADLERLQLESADANRRYTSELQTLKAELDASKADHEAEIQMLKANEARLIQDLQSGGNVDAASAQLEISRLQSLLADTQRAYTQKNNDLTRAMSDFANQTAALKASYDSQIAAINRDLTSCQSNYKKLTSDFTALNNAYMEQNSSILGSLTSFDSKVKTLAQQFTDLSTSADSKLSSLDGKFTKMFGDVTASTNAQIASSSTVTDTKMNSLKTSLSSMFESRLADERKTTDSSTDVKVQTASFSLSSRFDAALSDAQNVYDQKIKNALETARAVSKGDISLASQQTVDLLSQKLDSTRSNLQAVFDSKLADVQSQNDAKLADVQTQNTSQLAAERTERTGLFAGVDKKMDNLKTSLADMFESRLAEERTSIHSSIDNVTETKVQSASFNLSKSFTSALDEAQNVYDQKIKSALDTARAVAKGDISIASQQTVDLLSQKLDLTNNLFVSKLSDVQSQNDARFEGEAKTRTGLFAGLESKVDNVQASLKAAFNDQLVTERATTDGSIASSAAGLTKNFSAAFASMDDKLASTARAVQDVAQGNLVAATKEWNQTLQDSIDQSNASTDTKISNEQVARKTSLLDLTSQFNQTIEAARDASKGDFKSLKDLFDDKITSERSLTDSQLTSERTERASGFLGVASQLSSLQSAVDAVRESSSSLKSAFENKITSERSLTDSQLASERTERTSGFLGVAKKIEGVSASLQNLFEEKLATERSTTDAQIEGEQTERKSGLQSVSNAIAALDLKYQTAVQAASDASSGNFTGLQELLVGKIADERTKTDAQIASEQSERKTGFSNLASRFDDKISSVVDSIQSTFNDQLASERATTDSQIASEQSERQKGLLGLASNVDSKFGSVASALGNLEASFGTKLENALQLERSETNNQIAGEQAERKAGFSGVAAALQAVKDASAGDFSSLKDLIASERKTTDAQFASEKSERSSGLLGLAGSLDSKFTAALQTAQDVSNGNFTSLKAAFEDKIGAERTLTDSQIASEKSERTTGFLGLGSKIDDVRSAVTSDMSGLKEFFQQGLADERATTNSQISNEQTERKAGFLGLGSKIDDVQSAVEAARQASKGDFSNLKDFFETKIEVERATTDSQIASEKTERTSGFLGLTGKLQDVEVAVQAAREASKGDFSNLKALFDEKLASERSTTNAQFAQEQADRTSGFLGLTGKLDSSVSDLQSAVQAARDASKGDFSTLQALFESKIADERATTDLQIATEGKNTDGKVEKASTGLKSYFSSALDDAQILYDVKIKNALELARSAAKGDIAVATKETMDTIQSKLDTTASKVSDAFDNQLGRITGLESFQSLATQALSESKADFLSVKSSFQDQFATVGKTMNDVKSSVTSIEAKFDKSFSDATTRLNSLDTSLATLDSVTNVKFDNLTNRLEETVNTATKTLTNQFGLSLDVLSSIVNVNTQTFKAALENKIDSATSSLGSQLTGLGVNVDSMKSDFSNKFSSAFSSIDGLTSGLQQANTSITSVVSDVKAVAGKFDDVSRALGDVKSDFTSKFGSIDATIDTLDKFLAGRIDTVHEDVKATAGAVSDLENTFNKQVSTFQSDLQSVSQAAEKATNELAVSTGKSISALEEDAKTVVGRAVDTAKSLLESRFTSLETATMALQNDASTVVDRAAKETSSRLNSRFSDLESATSVLSAKTATVVNDAVATAKSQLESRFTDLESATTVLSAKTATVVNDAVAIAKNQLESRFSTLENATTVLSARAAVVVNDAVATAKVQLESRFASLETTTSVLGDNGSKLLNNAMLSAEDRFKDKFLSIQTATNILGDNGSKLMNNTLSVAESQFKARFDSLAVATSILGANGATLISNTLSIAEDRFKARFDSLAVATSILGANGAVLISNTLSMAELRFKDRFDSLAVATSILGANGAVLISNTLSMAELRFKDRFDSLVTATSILGANGAVLISNTLSMAELRFKDRFDSLATATSILGANGAVLISNTLSMAELRFKDRFDSLVTATSILGANGAVLISNTLSMAELRFKDRFDSLVTATSILGANGVNLISNTLSMAELRFKDRFDSLVTATNILGANGTTLLNNAMLSAELRFKDRFDSLVNATTILGTDGTNLINNTLGMADSRYATIARVVALENRVGVLSDDLVLAAKSGRAVIATSSTTVDTGPALEVELNAGAVEADDLFTAWDNVTKTTAGWKSVIPYKPVAGTAPPMGVAGMYTTTSYLQTLPNNRQLPIRWVSSWKRWLALVHYRNVLTNVNILGTVTKTTTNQTWALTSVDGVTWTQTVIGSSDFTGVEFAEDPTSGTLVVIGSTDSNFTAPAFVRATYSSKTNVVTWGAQTTWSSLVKYWVTDTTSVDYTSTVSAPAAWLYTSGTKQRIFASTCCLNDIKFANGVFIAVASTTKPTATIPSGYTATEAYGCIFRSTDGGITWLAPIKQTTVQQNVPVVGTTGNDPLLTYGDTGGSAAIPSSLKGGPLSLVSLAYSPTLDMWVAHDDAGLYSMVASSTGAIWTLNASTSLAQMNLVNSFTSKTGVTSYMTNVVTTWSSVLNAFVLCCPDLVAGFGYGLSSFLISYDGTKWTHWTAPAISGLQYGLRNSGALGTVPSARPVMVSAPDIQVFAIFTADNQILSYTRNGTDWFKKNNISVSGGSPATNGLSMAWSSDTDQLILYGLPGTSTSNFNVWAMISNTLSSTTTTRRAPVRVGTTTDTGLALYTGSNRPQLTILPGEGGVEVQTKLVIGNTEITEDQLVKLLALIS